MNQTPVDLDRLKFLLGSLLWDRFLAESEAARLRADMAALTTPTVPPKT